MTHKERIAYLKTQTAETISPAQTAKLLGGDPYTYNVAAKEGKLTLPHIWRGRNLRILVQPLLQLVEGGQSF